MQEIKEELAALRREKLLKSAVPAIVCACDRLIELVDGVVNRDYQTLGSTAHTWSARSWDPDYEGRRAS